MTDDLDTTFVAVVCAYFLSPSWFASPVLSTARCLLGARCPAAVELAGGGPQAAKFDLWNLHANCSLG